MHHTSRKCPNETKTKDKRKRVAEIREIEKVRHNEALCKGAVSPERRTRDTYNHALFRIRFGLGGWPARVRDGDGRGWSLVTVPTWL